MVFIPTASEVIYSFFSNWLFTCLFRIIHPHRNHALPCLCYVCRVKVLVTLWSAVFQHVAPAEIYLTQAEFQHGDGHQEGFLAWGLPMLAWTSFWRAFMPAGCLIAFVPGLRPVTHKQWISSEGTHQLISAFVSGWGRTMNLTKRHQADITCVRTTNTVTSHRRMASAATCA